MTVVEIIEHKYPAAFMSGPRIGKTEIILMNDGSLVAVDFWFEGKALVRVAAPRIPEFGEGKLN